MTCSGDEGHPRYRNGDLEDPIFLDGEKLFRRYKKEHYINRQLLPAAFQFPRQSFNREKYSSPDDVLHRDCCNGRAVEGWGVLECSSTDLPTPLDGPDGRKYEFVPMHRPCDCCYAHSKIWCGLAGQIVDAPSPKVKETFRVLLAQKMNIRIEAHD